MIFQKKFKIPKMQDLDLHKLDLYRLDLQRLDLQLDLYGLHIYKD